MSMEAKDILGYIGIEAAGLEELKTAFNEKYVPADKHKADLGAVNGRVTSSLTKAAKEIGVELSKDELKDKDTTEIPLILAEKVKSRFAELEGAKSATATEIESKYKTEIETWKTKANEFKGLAETAGQNLEAFKTEVATKEKQRVVGSAFDKAFGSLAFGTTVNDLTKTGFKALVAEKYKFDIDDEGNEVVLGTDGKKVPSKSKAASFANYAEVLSAEFETRPELKAAADSKKFPIFGGSVTPPVEDGKRNPRVATPFKGY